MRERSVEWKDTKFPFSINYKYSLFVRNRCVFFYCLSKNIRKMINYAEHFTHLAKICVIYIYGSVNVEIIKRTLSQKAEHIMLLISPGITKEDTAVLKEYDDWMDKLKAQGLLKIIKQETPKSEYSSQLVGTEYGNEPSDLWYKLHNNPKSECGYRIYTEGLKLIQRYKEVSDNITSAQCGTLDVLANFPAPENISGEPEIHDSELLRVIKTLYPYGVEADTADENAVKLLKIRRLTEAAIRNETTADTEKLDIHFAGSSKQLCFWENVTEGAEKCLSFLEKYCSEKLSEKGCIDLSWLWYEFSKPPFGAYSCNWYCYILATALRKFNCPDYLYGDGYCADRLTTTPQYDLINMDFKAPSRYIFIQNEAQEEFRRLFARLFDIKSPPAATCCVVTLAAMRWVSQNIKWLPLDCIDHRFYEIFVEYGEEYNNEYNYNGHYKAYFEFGYEKYLPWLRENFDELYSEIRCADEKFVKALTEKYGQKKADFYCRWHTVKGSAVGWLHTKEMLERSVKDYMEALICCECGRCIAARDTPMKALVYQATSRDTGNYECYEFALKDVIGINKKLLGRYRTDCLCIPCLAEYTEHPVAGLWEMMNDFKEAGCELFA